MRSDPETGTPPPSHRLPVHVIGNVNLDLVMGPVPPWPTPGTETVVEQEEVRAGGAAGVTALALQALGVTFTLHATIGRDDFGEVVRRKLGPARNSRWSRLPRSTRWGWGTPTASARS
ncbi:MAG TPA: carbohydrate kinase family protein [Trueperaceae bacterium]|nr:carbohydrate kinase family protein [Trueperaceae bacterium]